MLFGREQFTVKTEMGGEVIDKLYAKELVPAPIGEFEELPEDEKKIRKPYPFNQRTYEAAPGIICDQDVAVPMRDGVILYADIFRPADSTAKVPVILAWSNYCKRPNEYRPDELKTYTPGVPKGPISDLVKFEAAEQPPHLACIAPWEGMSDMYRESLCEGGIPAVQFTNFATAGTCGLKGIDDMGGMAERYPLMNGYWADKIPDFPKVVVPAYVTAGWNHFHLRGPVNG